MKTTTTTTIRDVQLVLLLLVASALELASQDANADQKTNKLMNATDWIFVGCNRKASSKGLYDLSCGDDQQPDLNKLTEFPLRTDQQPQNGQKFNNFYLVNHKLQEVPANRLYGLDIEILQLQNNNITFVHGDAFNLVERVRMLFLANNFLAELNLNTFNPLNATLEVLFLTNNKLGEMDIDQLSAALAPLSALETLYLDQNQMDKLPDLHGLSKLTLLSLANNHIELLVSADESQLLPESIRELNLARNYLKQIPPRVFFTLVDLYNINLSEQKSELMQVDDYAFEQHTFERYRWKINLSNNRRTRFSNKAFCTQNISIYDNSYNSALLSHNVYKHEVHLSNNALDSLNACIIRQLTFFKDRNVIYRPTITFKASQQQNDDKQNSSASAIACKCEVTRASYFAELDGECVNASGDLVTLSQFQCSDASALSVEEVNSMCDNNVMYDCANRTPKTAPLTELASTIEEEKDYTMRSHFVTIASAATSHYSYCYFCCYFYFFIVVLIAKQIELLK